MSSNSKLSKGALRSGNGIADPVPTRMLQGSILEYFSATHSYRVRTSFGPLEEVPRISRDPGDNVILPVDTIVVLHNDLGFWVIDGVMKQTPAFARDLNQIKTTEAQNLGGESPLNEPSHGAANFRGAGDPKDLLPNDWVRHSGDGNFIGVLAGGMNVIQSAPFAQVRTHALTSSVEIIANEYRHLSSMGDLEITNDGGKTSLTWRAGTDQSTQNGSNATNWTLRLDIGAAGDVVRFRTTTPQGQTLSEVHISPEGRISVNGAGGVDVTAGDEGYREDVLGNHVSSVLGTAAQTIAGAETHTVGGARTTQVSNNEMLTIGGGYGMNVTGRLVQNAGGGADIAFGDASRIDVTNGYLDLVLGDPAKGGKPGGVLTFQNMGGDVQVSPMNTGGKFTAFGSLPGSIELGADAVPVPRSDGSMGSSSVAPYSGMLYEFFNSMMSTLLNYLDTHTHGSAMGPTSPPLIPSTPLVQPQIQPVQSQRVKLGG